jgi:hypothetical protein
MRLYCYVVARDFGFAPNPFHGYCTLATCKPVIRRCAQVDDWVIGAGPVAYGLTGRLVYVMQVSEILDYDEYWCDSRFQAKKPNLAASQKFAYGDNIYHHDPGGDWIQSDSHHSLVGGKPNLVNIRKDTAAPRALIASRFAYWGGFGPMTPDPLHDASGNELCSGRNHRTIADDAKVNSFIAWFESLPELGCLGAPAEWGGYPSDRRQPTLRLILN